MDESHPLLAALRIDRMTVADRIELIGAIWDSIPDTPEALPLSDKQREEIERRVALADANPGAAVPWEELKGLLRDSGG